MDKSWTIDGIFIFFIWNILILIYIYIPWADERTNKFFKGQIGDDKHMIGVIESALKN